MLESYARKAYYLREGEEKAYSQDMIWFIWTSQYSPLFAKKSDHAGTLPD